MAEKDLHLGIIAIILATVFLLAGLDFFRFEVLNSGNQGLSILIAFILIAVGVYMVTKK